MSSATNTLGVEVTLKMLTGVFSLLLLCSCVQGLVRLCYYDNTAQYRTTVGRFFPEDVDSSYCSHLVFSSAFLRRGHLEISEFNDEEMYQRILALKQSDSDLKILLAVETADGRLSELTNMLTDSSSRANFINNALQYVLSRGFDGLSLDFKYPGSGASIAEDKERFTFLVQEMSSAFGSFSLLLGAAVPAKRQLIDDGYEPYLLGQYLDFLSVMALELQNPWEQSETGHSAPLLSKPTVELPQPRSTTELSVEWSMNYWASFGVARSKLLMGIPLYGLTYQLASPTQIGVGAPALGPGKAGPETRMAGYLSYYEVCQSIASGSPQAWDNVQLVPFMRDIEDGQDRWTSFENQESLRWKVDHMSVRGFGGYAVSSLDMDDFRGSCRFQRYYLLKYLSDRTLEIPTTTTSTTMPQPTTVIGTTESYELPEFTTEIDELPEVTTEIDELPEVTTEIDELPEVTTEIDELPEVTTEVDELPEVTTEIDEVPEVTTESYELPEVTTEADELPEVTTEIDELPEFTTEIDELPEVTTEINELPEFTTEIDELPEFTTEIDELPQVTTEINELPQVTTESDELPEVTTEIEELPEFTTEIDELPEVTTESDEVPIFTTESDKLPEFTTESLSPNTSAPPEGCDENGFMQCHGSIPNYFWVCDNGTPVLRECAPGTVCIPGLGCSFPQFTENPELPELTTESAELPELTTKSAELPDLTTESAELPELTTKSAELPDLTTESAELPELTTKSAELPDLTTESAELPELTTKSAELPDLTTESAELPEFTTKSAELPEVTTERVEIPEYTTKSAELPEVTTKSAELPEVTTKSAELPELTTKSAELPEVTTKSAELPEGTTAELPPNSCDGNPNGFMKCHDSVPNLFWTCDNGVAILRECAPGTVCQAGIGCTFPEETDGPKSLFYRILDSLKSLHIS